MQEIWKDIKGYEGRYQISNLGRVKSLLEWCGNKNLDKWVEKPTILTPTNNGNGYLIIGLLKKGKRKNHYIHRLVAEAFLQNPFNKPVINHKDYNKQNNNVNNLEWMTQKENTNYSRPNMKKVHFSNRAKTGEKGIYYRPNKNYYRVVIFRKEYGSRKTLEEAITLRDSILKEVMKDGEFNPTR